MRKNILFTALFVSCCLVVFVAVPAEAESPRWSGPLGKLNRGVINTATGWTELFLQPARNGVDGLLTGPAYAVGRTLVGPLEIGTFYLPNDTKGSYEPLIVPATPFQNSAEEREMNASSNTTGREEMPGEHSL